VTLSWVQNEREQDSTQGVGTHSLNGKEMAKGTLIVHFVRDPLMRRGTKDPMHKKSVLVQKKERPQPQNNGKEQE